jgi:hypothetical protein
MIDDDGDVAEFLKARRSVGAQTVYETSIHGGQGIAVGSHSFTQNVNVGVEPAALRELVAAVMPQLALLGAAEPQARAALDEIAEEAQVPQPDQGRVRKAFGKLQEIATGAGAGILKIYLIHKAQEWGILPETSSGGGAVPPAP